MSELVGFRCKRKEKNTAVGNEQRMGWKEKLEAELHEKMRV